MSELTTILLRKSPELSFTFKETGLELIDDASPHNSGTYDFKEIINITFYEEKTNRWISAISWFMDLITTSAVGGNFKDKAHLVMKLKSKSLKVWLNDAELPAAKDLARQFNMLITEYSNIKKTL